MSDSTNPSPRRNRLSMRDGAHYAGCSQRHFYDLCYEEEIPTYFAAGHRWVDQEDIDAYFQREKAKGPRYRALGYGQGKRRPGRPRKAETATASAG